MRRVISIFALSLLWLAQTGCIAVSAKEIHSGMRYDAVTTTDGRIYVVDKTELTAREVAILPPVADDDP